MTCKRCKRRVEILKVMLKEVEKTRQWRSCKGMKPTTDISDFAHLPPSGLHAIEWWVRAALEADE
jgi:hypothetical protein